MSKQQTTLMKFDPATGEERPYPSKVDQYREYHGKIAWLFNPWTGDRRDLKDVGSDVDGLLIVPPGEALYVSSLHFLVMASMAPKKRTVYVNFYNFNLAKYCTTENEARKMAVEYPDELVATAVPVEIEE